MVYLGGAPAWPPCLAPRPPVGARKDSRRISFWYGARSLGESFYRDYFEDLARQFPNFSFHLVLSEPQPEDHWASYTGMISEVLRENYLAGHPDPAAVEYYLCGPPAMVQDALEILAGFAVDSGQIAFDEF